MHILIFGTVKLTIITILPQLLTFAVAIVVPAIGFCCQGEKEKETGANRVAMWDRC